MYFLRIGEPYVRKTPDGALTIFAPQDFSDALRAGYVKGYWFVREKGVREAILYVTAEARDAFTTSPAVKTTTKQKALELIFDLHPLSLSVEETETGELRLTAETPYLEETVIKDSAGNELGRNVQQVTVSKPAEGVTETWTVSVFGREASVSYTTPAPPPPPPPPTPELTVSQEGSDFTLTVLNLADRTYDLYICDAAASTVDFNVENLVGEKLTEPYVDTLVTGDKHIAKANVEGTATNQVYYELT
jgi:hypothetical protein